MKIEFPRKLITLASLSIKTILVFEFTVSPCFIYFFFLFSVYFFKFSFFARVSVTNSNLLLTTMPTCRYGIKSGLRATERKLPVRDFKKENCLAAPVDYANIPPFYLFIYFFLIPPTPLYPK